MAPFDEPAARGATALSQVVLRATSRSVVIADACAKDIPLIYVNPAFEQLTGYRAEEVVGRNCRFLQGPDSDPSAVAQLRRALETRQSATVLVLNYRADGTAFWNEVAISPILSTDGRVTHFVGVQTDVTSRVVAEIEREAALLSETEARTSLESLLAAAPVGLAFFDRALRFTQVNTALANLTGLPSDQHLGRSLEDVFGSLGPEIRARLQVVLDEREPMLDVELEAEMPRRAGTSLCWRTGFYPVLDGGEVVRLGAVFTDITELRRAEHERGQLFERERSARRAAEEASERLGLLARAMGALADTMHVDRSLRRFLSGLVPRFTEWCAIDLADDHGRLRRVEDQAADPSFCELGLATGPEHGGHSLASIVGEVFDRGEAMTVPTATKRGDGGEGPAPHDPDELRIAGARIRAVMVIPIRARGRTIGVLSLARVKDERPYDDDDLALSLDLARWAGLAIDNARLYEQEHRAAETLQRALLPPEVPRVDGLEICVQYQPGADGAQVGGDWYDVVELKDGLVALSIGDVVGHDMAAAARMGELRTVLRAETSLGAPFAARSPAASVDRLDRFACEYESGFVATLLHGVLDPRTGQFTYARAGHLPPVIVDAEGAVTIVRDEGSPPLGLGSERIDQTLVVPPGATLLLYTDGLIERRGETIDDGFDRLELRLEKAFDSVERWCDHLLEVLAPSGTTNDDVAMVMARRTADA